MMKRLVSLHVQVRITCLIFFFRHKAKVEHQYLNNTGNGYHSKVISIVGMYEQIYLSRSLLHM